MEIISAANAALEASGVATGLPVGGRAPDFELPNAVGDPVRLYDRLEEGPVVLVFYRGSWCPYCNIALQAMQQSLQDIKDRSGSLIAISPQQPDDALGLTEKHGLEFDVLSDVDQSIIRQYGLQIRVPPEIEEVHLEVFRKDISLLNADGSWHLPIPATFVIDSGGTIRARHVSADYMQRMEPSEVCAALDNLSSD